jgi:hypothetical protein
MSSLLPFRNGHGSGECCFDVSDLLLEVVESQEEHALVRGVQVEVDAPPYVMVHADQGRMRLVFGHLLAAAVEDTPAGGEIVVTAYHEESLIEVEIAAGGGDGAQAAAGQEAPAAAARPWISEVHRLLSAEGAELQIWERSDGGTAYLVQLPRPGGWDRRARQAA